MERTVQELDGVRREVRIHLTQYDLKPHYEQAYVRAQASIELKGFRKGKVPVAIIKQQYGRAIEAEALETIADNEFRSFAQENKLSIVGSPALTDIQKDPDGVTFVIAYEVLPQFELGEYRGLVLNRPVKEVADADVEREIERICLQNASFEPAQEITDEMFVATITMQDLDRETSMPIIGAESREAKVFLDDDQVDMHLRSSLRNTKVGDSFAYVAETEDEGQTPPSYYVTVTEVNKVVPAEFNNALVEQITGGRFATTEELREDITRQLTTYFEQAGREQIENQIVDLLVQAHEITPPDSLVHNVVHQLFEDFKKRNEGAPGLDKLTAHDLEPQLKPTAERIVRWELIRNRIIEAEELRVEESDIEAAAARYGLPADQLRMVIRQNRSVIDQLLAEKAIQTIVDYAVINDVTVDAE